MLKKIIINNLALEINNKLYEENIISPYLYNYCQDKLSKKEYYNE